MAGQASRSLWLEQEAGSSGSAKLGRPGPAGPQRQRSLLSLTALFPCHRAFRPADRLPVRPGLPAGSGRSAGWCRRALPAARRCGARPLLREPAAHPARRCVRHLRGQVRQLRAPGISGSVAEGPGSVEASGIPGRDCPGCGSRPGVAELAAAHGPDLGLFAGDLQRAEGVVAQGFELRAAPR
jgi:hypothetical protein